MTSTRASLPASRPTSPTPTTPAARPTGRAVPTVRRIRPADAARMRALRLEMLADSPLAFLETIAEAAARPHAEFAARVAQHSTGTEAAQFVADPGGRLVGHAGGHAAPYDPALTVIFAVYLTPAWRRTGLLGELIEGVAAWSRAMGRSELLLEVVVGNDRAVRAYERLGFVDAGVRVPHPTVPALTELQMRRPA
jgi:RimJ/RimL family protein N-acetyltransferase